MILEESTVDQRSIRRHAREVIDHFNVATLSNLSDPLDQDIESFRTRLTDELIHAPGILRILNDSVTESILIALPTYGEPASDCPVAIYGPRGAGHPPG